MDIIFLVYGLAFLVMGLVIVIRQKYESRLELASILWLLAAFGFIHGFLEWMDLWRIVRGDNPGLAATRPVILLLSFLFLFEFGRRLVLISLSADARAKPACRLLGAWIYAPLLGGIMGAMAVSDQPALALAIWSRYLAGFFGSTLTGVGFHLYWRNRLVPAMSISDLRLIRIGSQVAAGSFIAYAILGGLVVPRADWFPASVINQENFRATFHVPVQLLRAACAVLAAVAVGVLLRIFHLEGLRRLRDAFQANQQILVDLRAHEERLQLATTAGDIGIWDWDVVRDELTWDESMYTLYGIGKEGFSGVYDDWIRQLHPDDRQYAEGEIQAALRGEREYAPEFRIVRPDGTVRYIKAAAKTFYDPQGNPLRMIGTNVDITKRKQAEVALLALNETLEQRIKEGTALNLAQEHLLIQQSRHAAMGEMIGNIAHQWRQPLSTVGLIVQNIAEDYREGVLDQNALAEYKKTAMDTVQAMSRTIDDFREFFQPIRSEETFSLLLPIREALNLIGASLKNSAIVVTVDCPEDLTAFGSSNQFSQAMLNLLANAKDALLKKSGLPKKIEVSAHAEGEHAIVCVKDNGGGIPAEIRDKIFDPYFTSKEGGTGIGLYMTKVIIEQHMHGKVTCRNTEEGAEFTIFIPRDKRA